MSPQWLPPVTKAISAPSFSQRIRKGQPSVVGCAEARLEIPAAGASPGRRPRVRPARFVLFSFGQFAIGRFAVARLVIGRFATAGLMLGRLSRRRLVLGRFFSGRFARRGGRLVVGRRRLPFRGTGAWFIRFERLKPRRMNTLRGQDRGEIVIRDRFATTLASCHFISPGTAANTSSGLTPGSSAGLGFSTFATLGFDFTAGGAGFSAEVRRLPERQPDSMPSPRQAASPSCCYTPRERQSRGAEQDSPRIRSNMVSHEVPSREEQVRLAQARLCRAICLRFSFRRGLARLEICWCGNRPQRFSTISRSPIKRLGRWPSSSGCQPPRANLLFQYLGHPPLRREAHDLAAGPMDMSAPSADPLQRLLQEVDGAAVVAPRADRNVEILVDHAAQRTRRTP